MYIVRKYQIQLLSLRSRTEKCFSHFYSKMPTHTYSWVSSVVLILSDIACLMVFNAIFNNISVISWRSVLLMEETGGPGENHRPVASH